MHSSKAQAIADFMAAQVTTQLIVSALVPLFVVGLVWSVNTANAHFSKRLPQNEQPKLPSNRTYRNTLLILYGIMVALMLYSNVTRNTPYQLR